MTFKPGKDRCPFTGKTKMDKKGAVTFRNLTKRLHKIVMEEYECPYCGGWHLTTISKRRKFRHVLPPT